MHILLSLALTLMMLFQSPDGNRRWDKFLDDYEAFGRECMAARGKNLSKKEAERLRAKSVELLEALRQMPPDVSEAQKARLSELMSMYGVFAKNPLAEQKQPSQEQAPAHKRQNGRNETKKSAAVPQQEMQEAVAEQTAFPIIDSIPALPAAGFAASEPVTPITLAQDSLLPYRSNLHTAPAGSKEKLFIGFGLEAGFLPEFSPGLSVFAHRGRWGGYITALSNFRSATHNFSCKQSDASELYYVWPVSDETVSLMQVSAGFGYGLNQRLWLTCGLGYGQRIVVWKGADGSLLKINDLSSEGVLAEAGLRFRILNGLYVGASASTIGFKTLGARIGINYLFE